MSVWSESWEDRYERRREEERSYRADVDYDVWRSGGDMDSVDYDRVGDAFHDGRSHESAARTELNAQHPRGQSEDEHYEQMRQEQQEYGPTPDQCCECDHEAVGYSEGQPWCAEHYRRRPALPDAK
jgi:hypothetical protein